MKIELTQEQARVLYDALQTRVVALDDQERDIYLQPSIDHATLNRICQERRACEALYPIIGQVAHPEPIEVDDSLGDCGGCGLTFLLANLYRHNGEDYCPYCMNQ